MTSDATPIEQLPGLARDETSPVFKEPWQAEAFALAVRLSKAGYFTWSEWTTVLTQQIGAAQARGDRDLGDKYYGALAGRAGSDLRREEPGGARGPPPPHRAVGEV